MLWKDDDWEWKTQRDLQHPAFWKRDGDRWYYLAMFDEVPLPMEWPVYVSHAEASAYARWAGKSLPTEAQWHRAAYGSPQGQENVYPWGRRQPAKKHGNFDFHNWHPSPVGHFPGGSERVRSRRSFGKWLGMDFDTFPTFPRISSIRVLSWVFGEFLRRKALRTQRAAQLAPRRACYAARFAIGFNRTTNTFIRAFVASQLNQALQGVHNAEPCHHCSRSGL